MPRRNDDDRRPRFIDSDPQPPSAPPGDISPARSKGSEIGLKIDEVSKGSANQSATSGLTSASRGLHENNTEEIDSQDCEYADAGHALTRQQRHDAIELLLERGSTSGVETLRAAPSQIQALAYIINASRDASLELTFELPGGSSTPAPSPSRDPGHLTASEMSKIESRINMPS